jgi:hypothetical protein
MCANLCCRQFGGRKELWSGWSLRGCGGERSSTRPRLSLSQFEEHALTLLLPSLLFRPGRSSSSPVEPDQPFHDIANDATSHTADFEALSRSLDTDFDANNFPRSDFAVSSNLQTTITRRPLSSLTSHYALDR